MSCMSAPSSSLLLLQPPSVCFVIVLCNVRRATSPLPEKEHQTLYGDHRRRTDVTCNLLVYLPPPLFYKSSLFPIPLSLWGLCVICSGIMTPYRCVPQNKIHISSVTQTRHGRGEISRRSESSRINPPHLSTRC